MWELASSYQSFGWVKETYSVRFLGIFEVGDELAATS